MPITEAQYLDLYVMVQKVDDKLDKLISLREERVALDKKKTLTISEAAEKTGKSYETIRRLIKANKLEVKEGSSPIRVTVRSLNTLAD